MTTNVKHHHSVSIKVENDYGTDTTSEGFDWDTQYKMYEGDVIANDGGWEIGLTIAGPTKTELLAALEDCVAELRHAIESPDR